MRTAARPVGSPQPPRRSPDGLPSSALLPLSGLAPRPGRPDPAGFCLNTTAAYVPSYSTHLLCDGCDGAATQAEFRWKLTDAAAAW